jgi:hypothetical protein
MILFKASHRPGQFMNCRMIMRKCFLVMVVVMLGPGGVGCSSIYHKAQKELPPEPFAQLKFRIKEAQKAEKLAEESITKLRDQLKNGLSVETIEPGLDRVSLATLEFERRVSSVKDAAEHCEGQTQLAGEIERLREHSKELLDTGEALCREGNSAHGRQLEDPGHNSSKP